MDRFLTGVMKNASSAISLDSENRLSEAYLQYLQCIASITAQLLQQGPLSGIELKPVRKCVQLGQQCMERISIILDKIGKDPAQSVGWTSSSSATNTGTPTSGVRKSSSSSVDDGTTLPSSSTNVQSVRKPPNNLPSMGGPVHDRGTPPLPSPGDSRSSVRKSGLVSPMELAYRQNQQLLNAYRLRTARMNHAAATNLSLTIQRKMAENLAIAKRREEALAKKMKERQQRLEEQATRRFSVPTGMSKKEQEQRQIYKRILEYEQDTKWLTVWRDKLEENPKDAALIHQLISQILRCEDHPLTQLLAELQQKLYTKLKSIVATKADILDEVKVSIDHSICDVPNISELLSPEIKGDNYRPFGRKESASSLSESVKDSEDLANDSLENVAKMTKSKEEASENGNSGNANCQDGNSQTEISQNDVTCQKVAGKDVGSENNLAESDSEDKTVNQVQDEIKADLNSAIEQNKALTKELKKERKTLSKIAAKSIEKTIEEYEDEISEEIWGGDDAENETVHSDASESAKEITNTESRVERSESLESGESLDDTTKRWRCLYSQSVPSEDEKKIDSLRNEAYFRHLKWISQDVHAYMEELQVMFIVAYEQLDTPEGRDQCYASLEDPFFSPVWDVLLALYRLASLPKELALADIMSRYYTASPKDVGVRSKLCLVLPSGEESENYLPYGPAISELQTVTNYSSPLPKLECLVRVSRCVCQCVEDYYNRPVEGSDKPPKQPSIGADDLLPILVYVIIRSQVCQVVSECQAMEEFIHEGYLMGEEGYCLTSLQTALNYIVTLHHRASEIQPI